MCDDILQLSASLLSARESGEALVIALFRVGTHGLRTDTPLLDLHGGREPEVLEGLSQFGRDARGSARCNRDREFQAEA